MSKTPKVAIIGRENVGKSTLFNRLTEEQLALVADYEGTTRDRNIAPIFWQGKKIELIDTAGYDIKSKETVKTQALKQFEKAVKEADLLLFVVDTQSGIVPEDRRLAKLIHKLNKPYILVANKADNAILRNEATKFEKLALGKPSIISSVSGSGTGDLLDLILEKLPNIKDEDDDEYLKKEKSIRISFLGQPNVGKSSLINAILNEDRVITSDIAFTTREPNKIPFSYKDQDFTLVDTAGIRKNLQRATSLEHKSTEKSIETLKHVDIIVLTLDVTKEIRKQDLHLAGLADQAHKGLIIILNKWDLVPDKDASTIYEIKKQMKIWFKFIKWAPIIVTSAKKRTRVYNILDTAIKIMQERRKEIPNKDLDKLLKRVIKRNPPPYYKNPKIKGLEQVSINPPTFLIMCKYKKWLQYSYLRYIENQIRKQYGFVGTAIKFLKREIK